MRLILSDIYLLQYITFSWLLLTCEDKALVVVEEEDFGRYKESAMEVVESSRNKAPVVVVVVVKGGGAVYTLHVAYL